MSKNNSRKLEGKVAVVTDGSRGIGAAIAKRLAADGASVSITYSKGADAAVSETDCIPLTEYSPFPELTPLRRERKRPPIRRADVRSKAQQPLLHQPPGQRPSYRAAARARRRLVRVVVATLSARPLKALRTLDRIILQ